MSKSLLIVYIFTCCVKNQWNLRFVSIKAGDYSVFLFNPLSTNGDQHQFSPNDIDTLSRDMVMRIDKRITKVKLH